MVDNRSSLPASLFKTVAVIAAVAALYGFAGLLAYGLNLRYVVTLWIPSGILLGILLSCPKRWWPAVLAGAYLGNVAADLVHVASPILSFTAPLANVLEGWLAATVIRWLVGTHSVLRSVRGIGALLIGGALAANAVTALAGGLALYLAYGGAFGLRWLNWWVGDGLGIIVVTPAVVGLHHLWQRVTWRPEPRRVIEAVVLFGGIVVATILAFNREPGFDRFVASLVFPLLIWAAFRFGAEAAVVSVCLFSGVALWFSRLGLGPLVDPGLTPLAQSVEIFAFLVLITVAVLISAAALAEHEQSAARARRSEESYRALVETAQDAIVTVDADGVIQMVNPAVRRLIGHDPEALVGRRAAELVPGYEVERLQAWMTRLADDESAEMPHPIEATVLHKNGHEVLAELVVGSWRAGDRQFYTGIVRDVSERHRTELQRSELQQRLAQAEKLESVGRLAGGVAHDFNNTLTVILGNTDEAVAETPEGSAVRLYLSDIRKAAERSAELVRQLLGFARKQLTAPTLLDLNDRVGQLVGLLSRLIGEEIRLEWRPGLSVWPVRIDPTQIDQIVTNLCINARDAISGPGSITISTGNATLTTADARADARLRAGDYVVLTVTDTGSGMGPEALKHLFEPFFTTKAVGKGTGLGLATIHGIVEQNHGFVVVDSEPGLGATFRVFLLRHRGVVEAPPVDHGNLPSLGGREIVLVVEDEPSILRLASNILTRYGYTVLEASTPAEALRMADAHTNIDVLVTDVVMPEMNGRDLATRLKAAHPGLKLLFTSGYSADIIADRGVLPQQTSFLAKPYSARSLLAKVQGVLVEEQQGSGRP